LPKKEVHHLSHIDLDGYSCQIIAKRIYENINFYNSNYGKEIDQRLQQIVDCIKNSENSEFLILFTDLNLTLEQAEFILKATKDIEDKTVELLLLDHHKTGQECANKYDWYNLDVNRCATKITYDYFKSSGLIDDLDEYVNIVNAYDIWLSDQHDRFEIGKVCARYVSTAKEINRIMFSDESFEYVLAMVEKATKIITCKDAHIMLDDMLHSCKKEFFIKEDNNTLDNLVSYYVVDLLTKILLPSAGKCSPKLCATALTYCKSAQWSLSGGVPTAEKTISPNSIPAANIFPCARKNPARTNSTPTQWIASALREWRNGAA